MNIPEDKLIRCAEGLGFEHNKYAIKINYWWYSHNDNTVPILLTYAPGGIMDKMGWMPEASWDGEHFFIIHSLTREHIVVSLDNKLNIPAAAIDAYLDTLEQGEKEDKDNNINNIEVDIKVMKVKLDQMNCELQRLSNYVRGKI